MRIDGWPGVRIEGVRQGLAAPLASVHDLGGGPGLAGSYRSARERPVPAALVGKQLASPRGACLLLHGRGETRLQMRSLASHLARETDCALLAIDQRGMGASDPAPSTAGIAEAEDVRAALAFLEGEGYPARRVVVVGNSQGAVAGLLASQHVRLAGLALLAPYDDLGAAIDRRFRHYAGVPRVPFGWLVGVFGEGLAGRRLLDVDILAAARASQANVRAVWSQAQDWRAPLEGARRIAGALSAELFVVPGADHNLLGGRAGAQTQAQILGFVLRALGDAERVETELGSGESVGPPQAVAPAVPGPR